MKRFWMWLLRKSMKHLACKIGTTGNRYWQMFSHSNQEFYLLTVTEPRLTHKAYSREELCLMKQQVTDFEAYNKTTLRVLHIPGQRTYAQGHVVLL